MLATIQDDRPGLHVASAVPTPQGDGFTIKLNRPTDAATRVGWFAVPAVAAKVALVVLAADRRRAGRGSAEASVGRP